MLYSLRLVLLALTCALLQVSGAPATIDSNGDPTWLSYSDMNTTDHSARVLRIVQNPTAAPFTSGMQTVWVVNARETIIGCYRFTDFLSPNWRTIFVFDKHSGDPFYNLTAFVRSLGTAQTRGAWFIETDEHYGEIYSRKVAFDFVKSRGGKAETLFGINCDIHPVTEGFYLRRTIPQVYGELYNFMKNETSLRTRGSTQIANPEVGRLTQQIFAAIPVILERTPNNLNSMFNAWVHGNDVSGFRRTYNCIKPASLGNRPWLYDSLGWPEAHIILFNWTHLERYSAQYFSVVQYLSEEKVLPMMLRRYNLTIIRPNEVVVLFDLAPFSSDLRNPAYTQTRNPFPMDAMLLRNYEILALARSPKRLNTTMFDLIYRPVNVTLWDMFGPAFDAERIKKHWVPSNVENSTLVDNEGVGRRFWRAQMMIGGYYENVRDPDTTVRSYTMARVYPTVYRITAGRGFKYFGTVVQNGTRTPFYTNDWRTYTFGSEILCATINCINRLRFSTPSALTLKFSRRAAFQSLETAFVRSGNSFEAVRLSNQDGPLNTSYDIVRTGGIPNSLYFSQATISLNLTNSP